jgi:hypothetical protein
MPDRRLRELAFGVAELKAGDRFGETLNKREGVLVLIDGAIKIKGDGFNHGKIQANFKDNGNLPVAVYCPSGLFAAKAVTDAKMAVFRRWCPDGYKGENSKVIPPEKVVSEANEGINVSTIFTSENPETGFVTGETTICEGTKDVVPSSLFNDGVKSGSLEGLMFFLLDPSADAMVLIDGPEGEENIKISNMQTIIVPASSSVKITVKSGELTCLWTVGKATT